MPREDSPLGEADVTPSRITALSQTAGFILLASAIGCAEVQPANTPTNDPSFIGSDVNNAARAVLTCEDTDQLKNCTQVGKMHDPARLPGFLRIKGETVVFVRGDVSAPKKDGQDSISVGFKKFIGVEKGQQGPKIIVTRITITPLSSGDLSGTMKWMIDGKEVEMPYEPKPFENIF